MTVSISEASPLQRAISVYKAGRLFEAEELCQAAIAERREFFDALFLLAVVQSALGKKDEALASYNRALEVRPHSAMAHFKRGQLLRGSQAVRRGAREL
jgi:tetratricopeptide (TPR) repeat protein